MSLTSNEQQQLTQALAALQQQIHDELRRHQPQYFQVEAGAGDDAIADVLSHDAVAQYLHQHTEWQALQRARARLSENVSDVCIECGETIPFVRLQAEPTAERCIACQTALEANEHRLHLHPHSSM
ncbi:TraR/DksA family transcriptional regulator [Undibacterium sp. SXout7W]|uniref:TraR/DksA family transcriptional regulator n=1 Tax=Undibacterium sp. SXout7W TaxID=3413049 RepID=UPI003BEF701D